MSIIVKNISKTFETHDFFKKNSKTIFKNLSFEIKDNEILGLVGPNGEGKTTLLKIISGLIIADSGEVLIDRQKDQYVGYVNSNPRSFYWRLTPRDNLVFFSKLLEIPLKDIQKNIDNITDDFNAHELLDKPFMNLSAGQMQLFNIIRAILKPPKYLMLDEPTTSLDVLMSKNVIRVLKRKIIEEGTTCIWCSHNMQEIKQVSKNIGVLKNKRFELKTESLEELNKEHSYDYEINKIDLKSIEHEYKINISRSCELTCFISFKDKDISLSEAVKIFSGKNIELVSIINTSNINKVDHDEIIY